MRAPAPISYVAEQIHRAQHQHGMVLVRLFVYDDRVEVRTPGGLPNTVTIEAIKLGAAHVLRNPTLYTLIPFVFLHRASDCASARRTMETRSQLPSQLG